jgi:large subunit ribosomal protein L18
MIKRNDSRKMRQRRHRRIRMRFSGTPERPRISVFRSSVHIYAQIIDDTTGRTLVQASSLEKDVASVKPALPAAVPAPEKTVKEAKPAEKGAKPAKPAKAESTPAEDSKKTLLARQVGTLLAQRAIQQGIKLVVFDRGGYLYHGRIKALADSARAAGLEF